MTQELARTPARVALAGSALLFLVLAAVLVPWDWVPGGELVQVRANEVFTAAELARAQDYARPVRWLAWSGYAVSIAVALVLGLTPWGARLVRRLPARGRVPLATLLLLLVGRLVTLPFGLVIRERRLDFGLTRQSFAGWLRDQATGLAVAWVAASVGLALLIWIARRSPRWWFAWAGGGMVAATFAVSFAYPLVVEPLFNRFTPMPDGTLKASIERLADQEGVAVDEVLVADASRRTTTLNAYVSGIGQTRRIVVYDNLVSDLPEEQVLIVVAHELAHAEQRDVLIGTTLGAVGALVGVLALALLLDSRALGRRSGTRGPTDAAVVPLVFALVAVGSFFASPVQGSMSRAIEARADRVSLEATQDPETFELLQRQLALTSLSDPTSPALARFWFGTHPSTLQRLGIARALFP